MRTKRTPIYHSDGHGPRSIYLTVHIRMAHTLPSEIGSYIFIVTELVRHCFAPARRFGTGSLTPAELVRFLEEPLAWVPLFLPTFLGLLLVLLCCFRPFFDFFVPGRDSSSSCGWSWSSASRSLLSSFSTNVRRISSRPPFRLASSNMSLMLIVDRPACLVKTKNEQMQS